MTYKLFTEDCLTVLQKLDDNSIDLAYLDPPFLTQKVQKLGTRSRDKEFSFRDIWKSHTEYADFILARLSQVRQVLVPTGSIFFHCDHKASHIVRLLLDEVFGTANFRSEIIWQYKRWSNSQNTLLPSHQTIYFYSKTKNYKFRHIYQNYSPATNVDQILQRRTRDEWGKSVYARDENGVPVTNGQKNGVPLGDVWDIPLLNPKARERAGYPTQKPVLLLQRIIELTTDEGDHVLDPFCGSGTSLVAAKMLGRHAIGIDISEDAISITRKRLEDPFRTESALLLRGRDAYESADQEALALLNGLDVIPVQRNQGIDALLREQIGGQPVLIRVQRTEETVFEAATKLSRAAGTKQAQLCILIILSEVSEFELTMGLPQNVVVVDAPAVSIERVVQTAKMKLGNAREQQTEI